VRVRARRGNATRNRLRADRARGGGGGGGVVAILYTPTTPPRAGREARKPPGPVGGLAIGGGPGGRRSRVRVVRRTSRRTDARADVFIIICSSLLCVCVPNIIIICACRMTRRAVDDYRD